MFPGLQDPVTDVAFIPMQIKPLILSFSLVFGHEAGKQTKTVITNCSLFWAE